MDLSTLLAVSFVIASFLISSTTTVAQFGADSLTQRAVLTLRWRNDLRSVVATTPLGLVVGRGKETEGQPHTSIMFIDNNTLVITFVVRASEPKLSARSDEPASNSPLYLRAIFIGAVDGKVKATIDWPTESRYAAIIAGREGTLITERDRILTLYSADAKEIRNLRLPATDSIGWEAHSSLSARNILFVPRLVTGSPVPWIWVDGTSLQVKQSWEDTHSGWINISDTEIAMTKCVWVYTCEPSVEVRSPGTDWKIISTLDRKNKPRPKFVDEEALFLLGNPTELIRASGEMIFSAKKSYEGCWWGEAVTSQNGARFLVPSCRLSNTAPGLDIAGVENLKKILLYDAPFNGTPAPLDLPDLPIKGLAALALSPDGLQLAILNNEVVELIQLPSIQ
jgi:hypothetical protein